VQKKRIIARIDVKNEFVIKGINLEGLRKIGDPIDLAKKYYEQGIDEIVFMDAVASLYDRNNLMNIIESACKDVFIPITIGGGIRSIGDIELALKSGADKITLNTQAIKNSIFIKEASRIFGSQCIVGSIEAKRNGNSWEAYINNGREQTNIDAIDWACKLEDLGIGELLITSVDKEGTKKGFDFDLIDKISQKMNIPIIVSGGAGNLKHITEVFKFEQISAVALASVLHYNINSIQEIKNAISKDGIIVRK
jgi:cyclase